MALRAQVVDLVRLHFLDDTDQVRAVGEISVVHEEANVLFVGVVIQMVHAIGIEEGRTTFHAVDKVSFVQKKLGQVGAVLTGDTGYESGCCKLGVRHRWLVFPDIVLFDRKGA